MGPYCVHLERVKEITHFNIAKNHIKSMFIETKLKINLAKNISNYTNPTQSVTLLSFLTRFLTKTLPH